MTKNAYSTKNKELCAENERKSWIFLNFIPDLGPMRFHRLLHAAQSAEAILELPIPTLMAAGVSEQMAAAWAKAFREPERWERLEKELAGAERSGVRIITELDPDYPALLHEVIDRPPVLYCKGRWPMPDIPFVGLVGTRRPSPYGCAAAERLTEDLVRAGLGTVSGLALGIDACVHRATLKAGGFTVAVLGCGLNQVYPPSHEALYAAIAEAGVLISEFPLEVFPDARNFPRRNRIISGLSKGIVVIEAGEKSGALITARYAAEQGRDVFAVPGSIFQPGNAGSHRLLKEGAKLVHQAQDVLQELVRSVLTPVPDVEPKRFLKFEGLEQQIFEMLSLDPISVDHIAQASGRRFDEVAGTLLALELKGAIHMLPGQRYVRTYQD